MGGVLPLKGGTEWGRGEGSDLNGQGNFRAGDWEEERDLWP